MTVTIFDDTPCALGEGPLWHPERGQLLWFDIVRFRLHTRQGTLIQTWNFEEHVSAAGWIDADTLLIASETKLFSFNLETTAMEVVAPLEDTTSLTRSNDGRADPWGGFWIGTMGKAAEEGLGAIYRYYRGELRLLFPKITIPNAICFTPYGTHAFFADTITQKVWRQALAEPDGWPIGDPEVYLDLSSEDLMPDGAVVSADGTFWNAQWGAGRVAAYGPRGQFLSAVSFDASHTTCPAFGGPDLSTLYCTSARQGLSAEALAGNSNHGATFAFKGLARGQAEHRVIL